MLLTHKRNLLVLISWKPPVSDHRVALGAVDLDVGVEAEARTTHTHAEHTGGTEHHQHGVGSRVRQPSLLEAVALVGGQEFCAHVVGRLARKEAALRNAAVLREERRRLVNNKREEGVKRKDIDQTKHNTRFSSIHSIQGRFSAKLTERIV